MKESTIMALRNDLLRDRVKYAKYPMYDDKKFEIEYIPILTIRDKYDKLLEITSSSTQMIFIGENGKTDK